VKKSELLRAIQQEIQRHDFSHFVENPPSVAQGGKGVVVPRCPICKKKLCNLLAGRESIFWVLEGRLSWR
jgi:hypothetical protein